MNQTKQNLWNTDRAWKQLYTRLEQEGLLAGMPPSKQESHRLRRQILGWAAAAILVGLAVWGATFVWQGKNRVSSTPSVTVANGNESSTLVTTLEDGSIVYLADHTRLEYPEHFPEHKREVALEGNALFDISGNRERPFIIETQQTRIRVLGTAFQVKSTDNVPFEVSVRRGEVEVTLKKSGQSIRVKAGETVTLQSNRLNIGKTTDAERFDRYTERIRFKDERLDNILRVLNLAVEKTRIETTPALAGRRLTVSFHQDSPETMAELICLALNVPCVRRGDRIVIGEP